ncbi:hypothetical protein CYMTET_35848, partial [Cymbomonas tetramitiformis]
MCDGISPQQLGSSEEGECKPESVGTLQWADEEMRGLSTTSDLESLQALGPPELTSRDASAPDGHLTKPYQDSATRIQENAELILELRNRVRQLGAEMNQQKEKQEEVEKESQLKVKKLQAERERYLRKLQSEKEAVSVVSEENRNKEEALEKLREENLGMRATLGKVEEGSTKGWRYVRLQNKRLQKLHTRQANLQTSRHKQTKARIQAQEQKDRMELQVNPLQQRNLDMSCRLQQQTEWHSNTLRQLTSMEDKLLGERSLLSHLKTQLSAASKQKAEAVEDATHTQLMVNQIFEENTDLQGRFDKLHERHKECCTTLK